MRTDIDDMNYKEMMQEIADKFLEMERVLDIPVELQHRFSVWGEFKEWAEDLALSYSERVEEVEKLEELEKKFSALQEEITQVSDDLSLIPDLDTNDEEPQTLLSNNVIELVNMAVADAVAKLDELADEDWKPGKPKNKKR